MRSRFLFASSLTAGLLAVGLLDIAPIASEAWAKQSARKHGESSRGFVLERKRRSVAPRIPQPIGPSYIYYDYPYYYARGHYPRHIVHYVYYPSYWSSRYSRYGVSKWDRDGGPARRRRAH